MTKGVKITPETVAECAEMLLRCIEKLKSGEPIKFVEETKIFEITAADYNKGIKYCLKKYPQRRSIFSRIRAWWRKRKEQRKGWVER